MTNLRAEVRGIADFLEITISNTALDTLLPNLSLEAMREHDARIGGKSMWEDGAKTFFFKGTNGRWRDVLSAEEIAQYDVTATRVLMPDCRLWLEKGRIALESR